MTLATRWHYRTVLSGQAQIVFALMFTCSFLSFWLLQGADVFAAKINIEVQRASEGAIAAVERNGGVITTSFYDPISLGK